MGKILLQEKIDNLRILADRLLQLGNQKGDIYLDDLSALHGRIHSHIVSLSSQHGKTVEQEASLCIALLMGYSVSMYANPDDESRRLAILQRSLHVLETLTPSPLKQQLQSICNEYTDYQQ